MKLRSTTAGVALLFVVLGAMPLAAQSTAQKESAADQSARNMAPKVYRLHEGAAPLAAEVLQARKLVLIYYANDMYPPTSDDLMVQRVSALRQALSEGAESPKFTRTEQERLAVMAGQYQQEIDDISMLASQDTRWLTEQVGRSLHAVVEFRNFVNGASTDNQAPESELFRPFQWTSQAEGDPGKQIHILPIPHGYYRPEFVSQPLAHPAMLRYALEAVAAKFDPTKYRFLLIIRSPTTRDNALAMPLSIDPKKLDPLDICQTLLTKLPPTDTKADKRGTDLPGRTNQVLIDTYHQALAAKESGAKTDSEAMRKAKAAEPGATKMQVLSSLFAVGHDPRQGMYFPLVLLASPRSALELSASPDLDRQTDFAELNIRNVGELYAWGEEPLRVNPFDSRAAFQLSPSQPRGNLEVILRKVLDAAEVSP